MTACRAFVLGIPNSRDAAAMPDSFRPAPLGFRISGELRQFHTVDLRFGEPDPFSNVGGSLLDREVGAMQVLRYFNQPRAGVIAIDINCVNIVKI